MNFNLEQTHSGSLLIGCEKRFVEACFKKGSGRKKARNRQSSLLKGLGYAYMHAEAYTAKEHKHIDYVVILGCLPEY